MARHSITVLSGEEVQGNCVFGYRGYNVSVSTVFNSVADSVAVYDDADTTYFNDVEAAIKFVDGLRS